MAGLALERRLVSTTVANRLFGKDEPPPTLGGYELLRRVGAGGMGIVFEARDPRSGQRLALKVLHAHGWEALQRLKQEFRALSHLHHENLVELHELSVDSEQPFLTMAMVDGVSLLDYVRPDGALRVDRLRAVLRQLVDAVSTLHAAGVVHRDLKPSNLLVRHDGRLVVLDFGMARALGDTQSGRASGTPSYMAPERRAGSHVDEASDWYSVGVITCEALGLIRPRAEQVPDLTELARAASGRELPSDLVEIGIRLCAADPDARPKAAELRAHFGLEAAPARSGPLNPLVADGLLVGRDDQLAQLRGAFARAASGQATVVHVSGEPGIGKTALARRFSEALRAEGAATVLAGACYERELIPYNAFDGLIDSVARELGALSPAERAALRPAGAADLCRQFPSLAPHLQVDLEAGGGGDPQRMRRNAFSALRTLLSRLAEKRPLVLLLDDLQWGDADSAQLLGALLEPAPAAPWLLIACYRGAAEHSVCVQALQRACPRGAPGTYDLELGPLDQDASHSLARALSHERLPGTELERISREASGSPLFLRALLQHHLQPARAALDSGSIGLSQLFASVLAQLPAPSRHLLELAAVAAEPVDRRLLLQAARTGSDETPWAEHLASLQHMGLLRRTPSAERAILELYHARVREAAISGLAPEAKRSCHRQLAGAAECLRPSDHELLATHHEGAGQLAQAAICAERAGDRALDSLALEHAASLYAQALRCVAGRPPLRLLRKLADATAFTGRCADSVRFYLDAAAVATGEDALRLRLQAAEMLLRCGSVGEAREVLTPVLRSIGMRYPRSPVTAMLSALAGIAWIRLWPYDPSTARREPTPLEGLRTDVCFRLGLHWAVDPPRTWAMLVRAYLHARKASTDAQLARALTGYALVLAMQNGSTRQQDQALVQARALAAQVDDRETIGAVLYVRAISRFIRSEFHAALEWINEARAEITAHCTDSGWFLQELDTAACCNLALVGDMAELGHILYESVDRIRESGNVFQCDLMDAHRGFALLARDEPVAAIEHSQRVFERWKDHESYQIAATAVWAKLFALLYVGDAEAADRLVQEQWPILDRRGYNRIELWRCCLLLWGATASLACAYETGERRHFAAVERAIERLRPQRLAWSEPSRVLLEAGLAHARGQYELAAARYGAAAELHDALRMSGSASAARMRQAALVAPEQAAPLRAQAEAYFREQGIARPDRFIRMFAPVGG